MSDLRTLAVIATLLATAVVGCGTAEQPADPDPEPTVTSSDPSPTPKPPTSSTAPERLTGVVGIAPEERCTVLTTSGSPAAWVLIGAVSGLNDGDRVTVVGRADPGATTRCQQGPVFVVAEVVPN